jgi:hypothetical protein
MFSLAFLPLAGYFFWLALLNVCRKPTVISGERDFMLLSCGLFGLLTLGPGRLLIPMNVLAFWGLAIWLFWTAFYFASVHLIARQVVGRVVIYHCPFDVFVPKLLELSKELDSQARLDGNVLFLPAFGIQCSLTGHALGEHLLLAKTGQEQDGLKWTIFVQYIAVRCRDFQVPSKISFILWSVFALTLSAVVISAVLEYPVLLETFFDHWL